MIIHKNEKYKHILGDRRSPGLRPSPADHDDIGHALCVDTGAYMARGFLTCVDVMRDQLWQIDDLGQLK